MVTRAVALASTVFALAGCGSSTLPPTDRREPHGTQIVAALAPLPNGGLRVGNLLSGRITDVLGPGGARLTHPRIVTTIRVATGGQRGLLGLAVDRAVRTFAAYVNPAGRIVVAQVAPGRPRTVWTGPPSTALADGGHLAIDGGGSLLIGIGDLQHPAAVSDPAAPNGKLLSLDPDGPAGQRPRVLSSGWNNPYAFATTPRGGVVVADNAPGRRPERIAEGRSGGGPPRAATNLATRIAPSGLAVISEDEIVVCGVRAGTLDRYQRSRAGRWSRVSTVARCRYGVARLKDGRLAVSGDHGISVIAR